MIILIVLTKQENSEKKNHEIELKHRKNMRLYDRNNYFGPNAVTRNDSF